MKTRILNLSAGSIPLYEDINVIGDEIIIRSEDLVKFSIFDSNNNYNIPLSIPSESYLQLTGWLSSGMNTGFFTPDNGSVNSYEATNYLFNGYYSSTKNTSLTAEKDSYNGFSIEKQADNKWAIIFRDSSNVFLPHYCWIGNSTNSPELVTNWVRLSGAGTVALSGNIALSSRPANSLYKINADYGDGISENLPLSFFNANLNERDLRYDSVTGAYRDGTLFYIPTDGWSHKYNSFSNTISTQGLIEFKYTNNKKINYYYTLYKSNKNLVDSNALIIESQSFTDNNTNVLLNAIDKDGTVTNLVQSSELDSSDSNGSDVYYNYLRLFTDTYHKGNFASSLVHIATASNYFVNNNNLTQLNILSSIKLNQIFTTTATQYIGLTSAGAFASAAIFSGVNKKLNDVINFNEFSTLIK